MTKATNIDTRPQSAVSTLHTRAATKMQFLSNSFKDNTYL